MENSEPDSPYLTAISQDEAASGDYRVQPHNLEVEQALLGAILVNNEAYSRISSFLLPEHFFEPLHSRIFEAARRLIERGQIATPITLKTYLETEVALAEVGGVQYLARLAGAAATIIHAEDYGRTIHDLALRRNLIRIGDEMIGKASQPSIEQPALEQIEEVEGQLFNLAETGQHEGGFQAFQTSVTEAVRNIEAAYKADGKLTGVATGMRALDDKLGGLHRSDLLILAGRPSMGKTALATNIAYNAARKFHALRESGEDPQGGDGAVVGFFSLEMSADQLATRLLAEAANIPSEKLRRGLLSRDEFQKLVLAAQELEEIPFFIDDTPALSIAALRTRARRLKRQHGLSLVIVDYLQLVRPSGRNRSDNRVQEVSEITQGLKALAKELDVPVLALSQLSRAVEQREDKRPQLADLRESGSIEQDADVVMFVYRAEYYHERKEPTLDTPEHEKWQEEGEKMRGRAELIIGKQRHGPTGTAHLHFSKETTRFGDLVLDDHLPDDAPF
jgi:replicative DNA helicase